MSSAPILARHHRERQGRSRPSRCRASRRSSTCSIASPVSRCGRSRRRRCRSPTCRARRRRRRSRSRPSRRRYARAVRVTSRRPDRLHAGAARGGAEKLVSRYKLGPMFLPPVLGKVERTARRAEHRQRRPAAPTGRAAALDPETHIVYAQASNHSIAPIGRSSSRRRGSRTSGTSPAPRASRSVEREGPGFGSAADAPQRGGAPAGAARRRRRRPRRRSRGAAPARRRACGACGRRPRRRRRRVDFRGFRS